MKYRFLLISVVTITIFGISTACKKSPEKKTKARPNIILVMADDQGYGDMGYTGHPVIKTPNFDKMAAKALSFDHFYAAAPVCSPTRASVMTGRHPNRMGCFTWGKTLRPQEITIAEALKKAGYVTGHFGKWHLGSVYAESPVSPGNSGFDEWLSAPNFFENNPILSREGKAIQTTGESSVVTVDAALEFIKKHKDTKQPIFAVVWFGSPHSPHEADEVDQKIYAGYDDKLKHFYGEISGMDRALGKLRESIQELGISENTILWYCSDNGGLKGLGRTGGRGNKGMVYEGGLRVPAILEWPARFKNHEVTKVPANTSDIYPTILELIGEEIPHNMPLDGISLAGYLDGNIQRRTKPMGFWDKPSKGIRTPSREWMPKMLEDQKNGVKETDNLYLRMDAAEIYEKYPENSFPGHSAWLDWPWKLHRIEKEDMVTWELYSLEEDPMETKNLVEQNVEKVNMMKPELEKWLVSVVNSLNGVDYK